MIDPRFHPGAGTMRFDELARRAGHAELSTPAIADHVVSRAADLTDAGPDALSFISQPKYRTALGRTGAGIVLTDLPLADAAAPEGTTLVPCKDPYGVFVAMLEILYPDATRVSAAASARMTTPADYRLEDDVLVGQGVSIGPGAEIGQGTVLGANCVIGAGVAIGRNCVIGAGCVIECAYLGNDIVLQSGVVIGSEGFGFRLGASTHRKIPQLGRVIVQDAVEIGANSTIDRGTLGDTVIGEGTKIDNLVQIGHNCRIGRHCVISGMCGLSGSTILEDGVIMGGGVGTAGHLTLGAGTTVLARTGVSHSFPVGSSIAGAPAQDVRAWKREFAAIRRLAKGDKA